MALHLIKLCVGADTPDDLRAWRAKRAAQGHRPIVHTRQTPKRAADLLDGGSLFWVFKGVVLVRQPILAVVSDQVWVVANFKESQLAHLRAGAKVDIHVDAVEGRTFHGTVDSFSPGTGAKFSLLPPDNATGNFTKVVQRVPVKILITPDSIGDAAARLAPGLSAFVKVSVRE